jgi:hypothetical protein
MQRNNRISPVVLLLIESAFSIEMMPGAVTSGIADVQVKTYDPPDRVNPCTIAITNTQFCNGSPIDIERGTTVVWKNDDPTPHTTTVSLGNGVNSDILVLPFQSSIPMVYDSPGVSSFSNQSPVEGTLVVVGS